MLQWPLAVLAFYKKKDAGFSTQQHAQEFPQEAQRHAAVVSTYE